MRYTGVACFGHGFVLPGLREKVIAGLGLSEATFDPAVEFGGDALKNPEIASLMGRMNNPIGAALERLAAGPYRINLHPKKFAPKRKAKSAWGIEVGTSGLKAVRVSRM